MVHSDANDNPAESGGTDVGCARRLFTACASERQSYRKRGGCTCGGGRRGMELSGLDPARQRPGMSHREQVVFGGALGGRRAACRGPGERELWCGEPGVQAGCLVAFALVPGSHAGKWVAGVLGGRGCLCPPCRSPDPNHTDTHGSCSLMEEEQ